MPTIEGQVLDKQNHPIHGLWVRVYQGDDRFYEIGYGITDENGRYEIRIDPGSPITIRYDDRRFLSGTDVTHPALVNLISGEKDHTINKVLHKVNMAYSRDELLEMLSTYERIYFIDTDEGISPDNEVRMRYPGNLQMVKFVDELTEQRLKHVLELYNPSNP